MSRWRHCSMYREKQESVLGGLGKSSAAAIAEPPYAGSRQRQFLSTGVNGPGRAYWDLHFLPQLRECLRQGVMKAWFETARSDVLGSPKPLLGWSIC
jgi:hypothetical protein